nr:mitochondrial amidoxime-reducing component 1-like isoform X3 [Procambarus clarkii]
MLDKTTVGVGVGVGVGAAAVMWAWRRFSSPWIPSKWEEVGEVGELTIYPIKSGLGVSVNQAEATEYGLARGTLEDRAFIAMTADDNRSVSGRQLPRMTMVWLKMDGDVVSMGADGYSSVTFDLSDVRKNHKVAETKVWDQQVKGIDCGEDAARLLTEVVTEGKTKLRLLYRGDVMNNRVARRLEYYNFPKILDTDRVFYAETCAYLIGCESSLQDLNSRLEVPVTMGNFRANIIVKGSKPSDEDDWAYVKIGKAVFRTVKPCQRCILTTVDPKTGTRHPKQEPLRTLRTFRALKEPAKLAKVWSTSPLMGISTGIDVTGTVAVGDKVLVARISQNPKLTIF